MRAIPLATAVLSATIMLSFAGVDFESALNAYKSGDYEIAFREFSSLASGGNSDAQYQLGVMYVMGRGVKQDYAEAFKWFSRGAESGEVGCLYYVGSMHINGHGTSKDPVLAYKWLRLAAARGHQRATAEVVFLAAKMSPEQVAEAKRLVSDWRPKRSSRD